MAKNKSNANGAAARSYRYGVINPDNPNQLILQNKNGKDTIAVTILSLKQNPDFAKQYVGMVELSNQTRMTLYARRTKHSSKERNLNGNGVKDMKKVILM